MVQRNFGADVYIREFGGNWAPITEAFFEEGKRYEWKTQQQHFKFAVQSIPMPMTKREDGWTGVIEMPFQSGELQLDFFIGSEKISRSVYVYPDKRKLTQDSYQIMLRDILEEVAACFQLSGLTTHINAENRSKKPTMLQWQYIEQSIGQLRGIFRKIAEHPIRRLVQQDELCRREQVKQVTEKTMRWLEHYGPAYGSSPEKPSQFVQVTKKKETYDVYENRVILRNLTELQSLLRQYKSFSGEIATKAVTYLDWISNWKRQLFLKNVPVAAGPIRITQVFRKHPLYRLWFNWFYNLFEFKDLMFDMKHKLALKDTFALYEMWCFMQMIKYLRQMNLLEDTASLFIYEDQQYFVHLKENHESKIRLKDGSSIYFQRTIQSNSNPYYSYTQRMIPDIVIEKDGYLYVLDPKYRVHANVHIALSEMHKYRDGILSRLTDERVVKEVYILTPQQGAMSEEKDFYSEEFQEKYKMGAFCIGPGEEAVELKHWLGRLYGVL